jgi:hypothetical protein
MALMVRRLVQCPAYCGGVEQSQGQIMMNYAEMASVPADHPAPFTDQVRLVAGICGS